MEVTSLVLLFVGVSACFVGFMAARNESVSNFFSLKTLAERQRLIVKSKYTTKIYFEAKL